MPVTNQTIAIIGAGGNMGSALALGIAGGNYRLVLFDNEFEKLKLLKKDIQQKISDADVEILDCAYDCSWEADIIILAISHEVEKDLVDTIYDVATQKIVVSICNLNEGGLNTLISGSDTYVAQELQQWLPYSKVVKAFHTTFSADVEPPMFNDKQVDTFMAGDDEDALQIASELMEAAGFHPVMAGNLKISGTLEHLQLTTKAMIASRPPKKLRS
jgi:predicted dinucleotide-binding enzyme